MAIATTAQVRLHNRSQVLAHLYRHGDASKQDLARALNMSLPTVTQNLGELEKAGLVLRRGFSRSTGGRKPRIYAFNASSRLAIGVRMTATGVVACAVDLRGGCVKRASGRLPYARRSSYYHRIGQFVGQFIESLTASLPESAESSILGVAFSMQGIVSPDGERIVFGRVMDDEGLTAQVFGRQLDQRCIFVHDAIAAAREEIRLTSDVGDGLCLYLNDHMSGAVIIGGELHGGSIMRNGAVEHMTLVPEGRQCYCGGKGCLDAYCSARALIGDRDETLEKFFNQVRDDEYTHRRLFHQYLDYLALAIRNMRTVLNCDVIIGGQVGQYLTMDDLADLKIRIRKSDPVSDGGFRIRKSACREDQDVIGAALTFVDDYVDALCKWQERE